MNFSLFLHIFVLVLVIIYLVSVFEKYTPRPIKSNNQKDEDNTELSVPKGASLIVPKNSSFLLSDSNKEEREMLSYLKSNSVMTLELLKRRLLVFGSVPIYPTVAIIKIGDGRKTEDFFRALKSKGLKVINCAREVMGQDKFKKSISETQDEVELVLATAKELTGKDMVTFKEILSAIASRGYDKCQPEDGPRLREAYAGDGEFLIAMDSINDKYTEVFFVSNDEDEGPCLDTCSGDPWDGKTSLIFRRRKND
ncbi:MAG: hypothetical protein UT05_C0001G0038 [Parcubacteria group bacterium GW2011_GWF2_38_76]|nr:MAG: hypothetical protein UT05_C0001G0038 [Parcubacteria group bacterium GW2011_GWF2_38_76]HBM45985.1 hypothetical protein [Patescibacteria group bacterium]